MSEKTATHTPGPWRWIISPDHSSDLPILAGPDYEPGAFGRFGEKGIVCDFGNCEQYYPTAGTEPNEADMALIAAAPDLLSAAKALSHFITGTGIGHQFATMYPKTVAELQAAISAAEGTHT